jgi:hypothetical protein
MDRRRKLKRRRLPVRLSSLASTAAFVVTTMSAVYASGASDADAPDRPSTDSAPAGTSGDKSDLPDKHPGAIEDTTTKRAAFEMAAYDDNDHVTVFTPSVALGIENVSGGSLHATYLVDVVSAASADIVSTASSRWQEVRQAGSLSGDYKPHDFGVTVGGSFSREPDYLSYGAYATVTKDFDEKNWTLFFGYGFSHDTIGRCGDGGVCTPFSVFARQLQRGSFNGGLNFVLGRSSLASVVGDVIIENGDQSKPYRYIPMFTSAVASTVEKGASIDWVNANRLVERPLEQLPLLRERFSLTGRYAHRFDASTLRLEERLYHDSWGLTASSSDVRWIFDLGKRFAVWPHARFHVQSSVSFWQLAYVVNAAAGSPPSLNFPEYRTGDRELGPLWTTEGGFGIKWYLGASADPERWAVQLTGDGMYTAFLDDLDLTNRVAGLGALSLEGEF